MPHSGWSNDLLAEFLATVTKCTDERQAMTVGVERAAEAFGAEVSALVKGSEVLATVGFPPHEVPEDQLVAVAKGRSEAVDVPRLGNLHSIAVPAEPGASSMLVVARCEAPLDAQEENVLRGMARVLVLALQMIRARDEERRLRERADEQADANRSLLSKLRSSQRRTRLVIDQAHDAFVAINEAGEIVDWSSRAEEVFGWSAAEILGERLFETIIPAERGERYERGIERFCAGEEVPWLSTRAETVACRRDGEQFPVELGISPLREEEGWIFSAFLRDVTERKRSEDQLRARAGQQKAVAELGLRALEGTGLRELVSTAVEAVAETLDAAWAGLFELQGEELFLRSHRDGARTEPADAPAPIPISDQSHVGATARSRDSLVVEQFTPDPRFRDRYPWGTAEPALAGASVAVRGPEAPFGVLVVQRESARGFSADDVSFLEAIANVLADAIVRQRSEEAIRFQALHDPLTGLPNRTLFVDRLTLSVARLRREGRGNVVIFLDIDDFKAVNDAMSHEAGDQLLIGVAQRFSEILRPSDTLARFGGDEFVILCEDVAEAGEGVAVVERLRQSLTEPFRLGGLEHHVSISAGIAYSRTPADQPEELIRNADVAMYRAKAAGRGGYAIFDRGMHDESVSRLELEASLRAALAEDGLVLHYQPIVSLSGEGLTGIEALVRWAHPERGLLGPAEFIGAAEQNGLIGELGAWVLRRACRDAARLNADGLLSGSQGVAVNVSPSQLADPGFCELVVRALDESGLSPGQLVLEVTETAIIDDTRSAAAALAPLRDLGVRLALDDFGTGYSSLCYLRTLDLDVLKLDRGFIADLDEHGADAIVAAVLSIARSLGMSVVAEGVERADQVDRLLELRCELAQGYYFARPMELERLVDWLRFQLRARPTQPSERGNGDIRQAPPPRVEPASAPPSAEASLRSALLPSLFERVTSIRQEVFDALAAISEHHFADDSRLVVIQDEMQRVANQIGSAQMSVQRELAAPPPGPDAGDAPEGLAPAPRSRVPSSP